MPFNLSAAANGAQWSRRRLSPTALRGSIGVRNFALLRRLVDDVVTVSSSEKQIVDAMRIVLRGFQAAHRAFVGGGGCRGAWRASWAGPVSGWG